MFDSTKKDLKSLLHDVHSGRLQLPEFQRDYVWGDEAAKSLVASVAKGFPVGALLTLEAGGEVQFKPRAIAGSPNQGVRPDDFLLDGQQRITSLYQSLLSKQPVCTLNPKGKEVQRFYYLDMEKAIPSGSHVEQAIVGVPADRIVRTNFAKEIVLDLSSPDKEYRNHMFPLNAVFDREGKNWFYNWRVYWQSRVDPKTLNALLEMEQRVDAEVIERISRYEMPIIRLNRESGREAICLVFEKVNVGGKPLDAFELLTAIFAGSSHDLREDWIGTRNKPGLQSRIGPKSPHRVLCRVASTDYLQACTLLHTRERRLAQAQRGKEEQDLPQISCGRDALLALPLEGYKQQAEAVEDGFIAAAAFLNEQKIFRAEDVPYPTTIVGLAATYAILGKHVHLKAADSVTRWFWSATLGELFGSSTETRLARDVPELVDWIQQSAERPQALEEASFQQQRLLSLRRRNSAAYKGIHALVMRHGCRDFITGKPNDIAVYFDDNIDIHHVFPQAWCKKNDISDSVFNSVINKTPLSARTNRIIGGRAPSQYLRRIEEETGLPSDKLDDILRSHLIEPAHLRNDDFSSFFEARKQALTRIIGEVMGKPVVVELGANEEEREVDDDEGDEL